jgi:hypothetical protein
MVAVADPHHFFADSDPAFLFNADLDLAFHLNADADPDPAPHQSDTVGPATTEIHNLQGSILSLQTSIVSVYGSIFRL